MTMIRLCKDCRWAALEKRGTDGVDCTHPSSKFVRADPRPEHLPKRAAAPLQ
jgi:hypothetical protein